MKKLAFIITISALFASCNQTVDGQEKTDLGTTNTEEVQKTEPTDPKDTEVWEPVPPKVNPFGNNGVPSDAILLFNGSNFDEWVMASDSTAVKWELNPDGSMTVKDKTGDIQTKRNFGSMQLHIEWRSNPDNKAEGQARSNSGVFIQKRYEVQVLDNNDNTTYSNGQVGSVYKQSIPLAMASVPTGEWNSYDMIFHAPEFDETGELLKAATVTVLHNGVLIQDHFSIQGPVEYLGWPKYIAHGKAPIQLQDHQDNSGVRYRNIWVRELN